jgi:hypothetical protein
MVRLRLLTVANVAPHVYGKVLYIVRVQGTPEFAGVLSS